jgi:ankyrin repeat protein
VAPEVIGSSPPPSDVLADPFPSDVYSLGMLLFEILLDGKIPETFTSENDVILNKCLGDYPVPLEDVQSDDSFLSKNVIGPLKGLVKKCCEEEREERISLQDCLSVVEKVHSDLFSSYRHAGHRTPCERDEDLFIVSKGYEEMMCTFHDKFPDVHDYLVLSPSWNMVISEDGALLVHRFCSLDFVAGIQYIVEKSTWDFQAERDIPYMSLLCVENESLSTLKYIAASWRDVLRRQLLLIHKACNSSNLDIFKLLLDIGIDFDTWVAEEPFMKPIHQLAAKGKTEFLKRLLDHPGVDAAYINTASHRYGRCYDGDNTEKIRAFSSYIDGLKGQDFNFWSLPDEFLGVPKYVPLYYAVVEDRVDTVNFILQRGGTYVDKGAVETTRLIHEQSYWFSSLLHLACESFSMGVVLALQYTHEECASSPSSCLRQHVDDVALLSPSRKPIHVACQKGKEKVFEAAFDLFYDGESFYIIRALMFYIARGGSKEMVDKMLGQEPLTWPLTIDYFFSKIFSMGDVACLLVAEGTSPNSLDSPHSGDIKSQRSVFKSQRSVLDVAAASGNTEIFQHILKLQRQDSGSEDVEDGDHADGFEDLEVNEEALIELSSHLEAEVISMHFGLDNPFDLARHCCIKGHVGVLKFYEDCGLDLDAIRDDQDQDSILIFAVDYGHIDMVKYLLERGFLVDSTNWYIGETPLQHACSIRPDASRIERQHKMDIASLLLEKGADPNYVNQEGYTAMDQALDFNDKEVVRLLVDHGFGVGSKNRYGEDYMTGVANI